MKNKYSRFYVILKQINKAGGSVTKSQLVSDFTEGRTTSLTDLSYVEFQELERRLLVLKGKSGKSSTENYSNDPLNNTRRAIIAQFKSIGRTTADAIAWAEKYGVNGDKLKFNDYNGQQLFILLKNAKKMKADFVKSINKKLSNGLQ